MGGYHTQKLLLIHENGHNKIKTALFFCIYLWCDECTSLCILHAPHITPLASEISIYCCWMVYMIYFSLQWIPIKWAVVTKATAGWRLQVTGISLHQSRKTAWCRTATKSAPSVLTQVLLVTTSHNNTSEELFLRLKLNWVSHIVFNLKGTGEVLIAAVWVRLWEGLRGNQNKVIPMRALSSTMKCWTGLYLVVGLPSDCGFITEWLFGEADCMLPFHNVGTTGCRSRVMRPGNSGQHW